MACGSCGGKKANTDYEVTMKDGTVKVVASMAEVRILRAQDTSVGRPATTVRAVPRKA